jgi:hypothetical protein
VQRKDSTKRSRHIRNFEWGCEFVLFLKDDLYFKGKGRKRKASSEQPTFNESNEAKEYRSTI